MRGHEVTVLTSSPNTVASRRTQNRVRVVERPSMFTVSQAKIAPSLVYAGLRHEFDIVHAHAGNPPAPFGAMSYSLMKRVPFVLSYHGDPQPQYGSAARRLTVHIHRSFFLRILLRRADAVLVPSIDFLEDSQILRGLRSDYVELPNGIRPVSSGTMSKESARRELNLPREAFIVLYLGSLNPYKAPGVLLQAAALVSAQDSTFRFVFVGDGTLLESLRRDTVKLGLGQRVRFEGHVPSAVKPTYLAAADTLVLPSTMTQEVFPITILEAFAAGLPVVVSDLRTFRNFVRPGANGVIVERGNPVALANELLTLRQDEKKRLELADGARQCARDFDWERIALRAEDIYKRTIQSEDIKRHPAS
jgi:glycosyltransferase involved in cell wall biosynthesis